MRGANGDALEWALALLRNPGQRHLLRERPLPSGVAQLLEIAGGGASAALAEAALRHAASPAELVESARFYAREVLFHPQADAYRTLGLHGKAGSEEIRTHHRLLQHWLHPDRLRSDEDSVFAGRINAAWNHLRTPERRAAYDLGRDGNARVPEVDDSGGAHLRAVPAWTPAPEASASAGQWQRRAPAIALIVACVGLGWMILRDNERPDAWQEMDAKDAEATAPEDIIGVPRREVPPTTQQASASSRRGDTQRHPTTRPAETIPPKGFVPPPALIARPAYATHAAATTLPATFETAPARPEPATPPQPSPVAAPPVGQLLAASEPPVPVAKAAEPPPLAAAPRQPAPAKPRVDFARIQLARQAGGALMHYLAMRTNPSPPIWNSPAIQSAAERLRLDLHGGGRIQLAEPQWRIGDQSAMISSFYRLQGESSPSGRLTADLVWRDNQWLVTGLSMERAQ